MLPQDYENLSDLQLLALAVFRESRGEMLYCKRAVAHVIKNRVDNPGWWGTGWHGVILQKFQFSSFNPGDPNANIWPDDDRPAWTDSLAAASAVLVGQEPDNTDGATHYHDISMGWPTGWGNEADWVNTLNIGRFRFYKQMSNQTFQRDLT